MNSRSLTLGLALAVALLTGRAHAQAVPVDPTATPETKRLLSNLYKLLNKGVLFGHQDDMAYGLTPEGKRWIAEPGRSDVKSVAGTYPAVFGWELGHIEVDSARNVDAVPFADIRRYIVQAHAMGAVNTISWHLDNPHNGHIAADTARTVRYILPGAPDHAKYVLYLDRLAAFLGSLKDSKGKAIPVIFRPFHEQTGNWFWWGAEACTPAEYTALWKFTITYLREQKGLHNLLIAYSTDKVPDEAAYLAHYPGDAYADVLGFDFYHFGKAEEYRRKLGLQLAMLTRVSQAHHKLPALTEAGSERLPEADWWTQTLLPLLKEHPVSYVLVWRNGRPDHFYAPYPGQASAADFQAFAKDKKVLMQKQLAPLKIYSKNF